MPFRGRTRVALAVLLLALPVLSSASEAEMRDARAYFFTQTFGDLREELQVARDTGRIGMLLFFEAESCPYCQHMIRHVFGRKDVQDWYGERFISIAVDIHGDVELTDFDGITLPSKVFSGHRKVFYTPVVAFIDLDGNEIYRYPGMIETPEEFLQLGEFIEGEHYHLMEYRTFAERRGVGMPEGRLVTPGGESE
jgi:thioredoxin-related protein